MRKDAAVFQTLGQHLLSSSPDVLPSRGDCGAISTPTARLPTPVCTSALEPVSALQRASSTFLFHILLFFSWVKVKLGFLFRNVAILPATSLEVALFVGGVILQRMRR